MAFVNFATREITAKIVYYGPGLGGKTTSLQFIHNNLAPENKGKMISLATEEDRTIYFDFLPLNLGKIQDFAVRVQLGCADVGEEPEARHVGERRIALADRHAADPDVV